MWSFRAGSIEFRRQFPRSWLNPLLTADANIQDGLPIGEKTGDPGGLTTRPHLYL